MASQFEITTIIKETKKSNLALQIQYRQSSDCPNDPI